MRRTIADLTKQQITVMEGKTLVSCTPARIELHEFDAVKVDQDWYVVTAIVDDEVLEIERIIELNVLDDYLLERQCEELNEGDM